MLTEVIDSYRNNIKKYSTEFLDILSDFLQEQSQLEVSDSSLPVTIEYV